MLDTLINIELAIFFGTFSSISKQFIFSSPCFAGHENLDWVGLLLRRFLSYVLFQLGGGREM